MLNYGVLLFIFLRTLVLFVSKLSGMSTMSFVFSLFFDEAFAWICVIRQASSKLFVHNCRTSIVTGTFEVH